MPDDILPVLPTTPQTTPDPVSTSDGVIERRCGFCGSRLDKKGNVIERGKKVLELMEAEDTIAKLRKELAAEKASHGETAKALADARAGLTKHTERKFGECL